MIPGFFAAASSGAEPIPVDPIAQSVFDKLVSWWDFDGNMLDVMGANPLDGDGDFVPGHIGGSLDKSARAERQGALGLPDLTNIGPGGVSFGGWCYVKNTSQEDFQLLSGTTESLRLAVRNGNQVHLISGHTSTSTISSSVGAVSVGNWFFWVGTFDRVTKEMRLYVGDSLADSGISGPDPSSPPDRISFGRVNANTYGALRNDAAFVCDGVLTAEEVAWLYNNGAGRSGNVFSPFLEFPEAKAIGGGAWTWFNDPRAIHVGAHDVVGVAGSSGEQRVYFSDDSFQSVGKFDLDETATRDDHDNPALLARDSDSRIVAAYVRHNAAAYNIRISNNPADPSAWGGAANIAGQIVVSPYASYANLIELPSEGKILNLFRNGATPDWTMHVSESFDGGATFGAGVAMLPGGRPYMKAVRNGDDRIDFLVTDGHPGETQTSVYHFYYQDGDYRNSAGSIIGPLPLSFGDLTKLWDGTGPQGRGWTWDIVPDGSDVVAVFANFPTASDHRYRFARLAGGVWAQSEVCAAGDHLYTSEPYYSGGICVDPDDPSYVYACRESGGEWGLYRYRTLDGGASWGNETLLFKRAGWKVFRPYVPAGSDKVFFCAGIYSSYTAYRTNLWFIPISR